MTPAAFFRSAQSLPGKCRRSHAFRLLESPVEGPDIGIVQLLADLCDRLAFQQQPLRLSETGLQDKVPETDFFLVQSPPQCRDTDTQPFSDLGLQDAIIRDDLEGARQKAARGIGAGILLKMPDDTIENSAGGEVHFLQFPDRMTGQIVIVDQFIDLPTVCPSSGNLRLQAA